MVSHFQEEKRESEVTKGVVLALGGSVTTGLFRLVLISPVIRTKFSLVICQGQKTRKEFGQNGTK